MPSTIEGQTIEATSTVELKGWKRLEAADLHLLSGAPSALYTWWSLHGEVSPLHRKADGSLWCSTDKAGANRFTVEYLSITVEFPNLTGGTESNTDAKCSSQVDAHAEAYGPPSIPSFTAKYSFALRHPGFKDWSATDSLNVP